MPNPTSGIDVGYRSSPAFPGDLNNDGFPDLVVGFALGGWKIRIKEQKIDGVGYMRPESLTNENPNFATDADGTHVADADGTKKLRPNVHWKPENPFNFGSHGLKLFYGQANGSFKMTKWVRATAR